MPTFKQLAIGGGAVMAGNALYSGATALYQGQSISEAMSAAARGMFTPTSSHAKGLDAKTKATMKAQADKDAADRATSLEKEKLELAAQAQQAKEERESKEREAEKVRKHEAEEAEKTRQATKEHEAQQAAIEAARGTKAEEHAHQAMLMGGLGITGGVVAGLTVGRLLTKGKLNAVMGLGERAAELLAKSGKVAAKGGSQLMAGTHAGDEARGIVETANKIATGTKFYKDPITLAVAGVGAEGLGSMGASYMMDEKNPWKGPLRANAYASMAAVAGFKIGKPIAAAVMQGSKEFARASAAIKGISTTLEREAPHAAAMSEASGKAAIKAAKKAAPTQIQAHVERVQRQLHAERGVSKIHAVQVEGKVAAAHAKITKPANFNQADAAFKAKMARARARKGGPRGYADPKIQAAAQAGKKAKAGAGASGAAPAKPAESGGTSGAKVIRVFPGRI